MNRLILPTMLLAGAVLYFAPTNGENAKLIHTNITASYDNGITRQIRVSYPEYASIGIHQSRGAHRLSTWEYCMFKGLVRCEKVLVYGVNYIK